MPETFETRLRKALLDSEIATSTPSLTGTGGDDSLIAPFSQGGGFEIGTRLFGRGGCDTLTGSNGNDLIFGEIGKDSLVGGTGRDFLLGGDGRDSLDGGIGDDILYGGAGRDTLVGGANTDRYVLNTSDRGRDEIVQFIAGSDFILVELTTEELQAAGLTPGDGGSIAAANFVVGPAATNAEQNFIFDPVARTLSFDRDGDGDARAKVLAHFTSSTDVDFDSIAIVSSQFSDSFPFL